MSTLPMNTMYNNFPSLSIFLNKTSAILLYKKKISFDSGYYTEISNKYYIQIVLDNSMDIEDQIVIRFKIDY